MLTVARLLLNSYVITLTPYGDASLYVSDIGVNQFSVRARNGGSVRFAWRFSAIRKGYRDERLRVLPAANTASP